MKANIAVHLNKEDKISNVGVVNNFGSIQYQVVFESGYSILIDDEILKGVSVRIPIKKDGN